MADDLFSRLRQRSNETTATDEYSFQGSLTRPGQQADAVSFRARPGVPTPAQPPPPVAPHVAQTTPSRPGFGPPQTTAPAPPRSPALYTNRNSDGDRPFAYAPPALREQGVVHEWQPPTFGEVLKDLGLRIIEAAFGAVALAVGNEIYYFFQKRRFLPSRRIE